MYISEDFEAIENLCNESTELLKDAVKFMNQVPNNKYGNNYELCSKIDNFLKEANGDNTK